MTNQLEITSVMIGPPRPTDPPELLCRAEIVLCGCFAVRGIRLVAPSRQDLATIQFPLASRIGPTCSAQRHELASPTTAATRSMIEWAVLRLCATGF